MSTETAAPIPFDVPNGWACIALEQLVEASRGISYGIVQPGQHEPDGVPVVRVNNVRSGRIDTADVLRVSRAVESKHERTRLRGGEVLLSLVGTLGECAVVPEELRGWNVARAIGVIPLKPGVAPRWVAYCLRSAPVQALMRAWATTTVQATLNLRDVRQIPILLAPEPLRAAIMHVVDSLDDKIDTNRRTAQALERLAQTVFGTWFMNFEPVKAKAAGAATFPSMSQEIFDALPARFADSDVGPVPEGWEVKPIATIATFLNGLALQKYPPRGDGEDLRVIKIAELRKGSTESADWANGAVPEQYVVNDRDLLFSWSGTLEAGFWLGGTGALNQHLFKVTSSDFPSWFCLLWIRQHLPWFRAIAASKATTMGHINRSHLQEAQVVVPSSDVLRAADAAIGPLYDMHAQLIAESRKLAEMRDYLLPRLLSGRVRVGAENG
jgi:type I restriction enzyme S subunit